MKTKILSIVSLAFLLTFYSNAQIKVLTSGELNLGKTNGYPYFILNYTGYCGVGAVLYPSSTGASVLLGKAGYYFGGVYTTSVQYPSDARYKENIKGISNALELVKKLNGITFDYSLKFYNNNKLVQSKAGKNQLGFIAQDVQKVMPQIVMYDDSTDSYSMDYAKLVPVLVEAIKEQQIQIDSLIKLSQGSNLKSAQIATTASTENSEQASLDQNAPNPFSQSTLIGYYLPETINSATLNIYNMSGAPVKTISIFQKGKGRVTINGSELNPGMYLYTLIADGKEVDTKRMILTE
jgi:hypothetical protein